MRFSIPRPLAAAALVLAACTPALNWREVRPEGTELLAMFPCKPQSFVRQVPLAGQPVQMHLLACEADGIRYAVIHAQVGEPAGVTPALQALRSAAADNLGGVAREEAPARVAGMTPNPQALRFAADGRSADGTAVREQAAVFARGLQVFQATVVGPQPDPAATQTFFDGLRLGR